MKLLAAAVLVVLVATIAVDRMILQPERAYRAEQEIQDRPAAIYETLKYELDAKSRAAVAEDAAKATTLPS